MAGTGWRRLLDPWETGSWEKHFDEFVVESHSDQGTPSAMEARRRAADETRRRHAEARANQEAQTPRWGTPEAKATAREKLRCRIEALRNADKVGKP